MKVPTDLKYTESHEWTKVTDDGIIVGITEYAQSEMGDIVFADLPPVGAEYKKGESMAVIESVKAVSDIFSPVGGTVVEVNVPLLDSPELINDDCYGEGWLVKLSPESEVELNALLSAEEYQELLEKEG